MARTRTDSNESVPPLRLRIPPSLAIAVLGGAASLAVSIVACEESPIPPPPADAGQIEKRDDAGPDSSFAHEGDDAPVADAAEIDLDAAIDAAPVVVDAYVAPDAPETPHS